MHVFILMTFSAWVHACMLDFLAICVYACNVCPSVCLSVCLSVSVSVQVITVRHLKFADQNQSSDNMISGDTHMPGHLSFFIVVLVLIVATAGNRSTLLKLHTNSIDSVVRGVAGCVSYVCSVATPLVQA